jgi:hypothetical protein
MCLSCGKLFATAESVNLHLNIHYEDKIYACEHCEKIFSHRHVYESHRKAAHGGEVSPQKKGPDYDCSYCGHAYPNLVSLDNHELACSARPVSITPLAVQEAEAARSPAIKISTPSAINSSVALNNNNNSGPDKPKKANRPPPMLILLNSDSSPGGQDDSFIMKKENMIKQEEVDEEDSDADWTEDCLKVKLPTLRPKPATALLSDEAKKIFANSAPQRRSSGGSNPRAHKIVETADGREYIPDTNSNNILHLEGIAPPPDNSERKKGYMLRPVGRPSFPLHPRHPCALQPLIHPLQAPAASSAISAWSAASTTPPATTCACIATSTSARTSTPASSARRSSLISTSGR